MRTGPKIWAFALAPMCLQAATGIAWNPIQPEDLSRKTSVIEKNADAEAIFWEIRLSNQVASGSYPQEIRNNYIRIKIYTDRGRETQGSIEIPYFGKSSISGVGGRTILPDGKIIELSRDAIFDKVAAKGGGFQKKVISFAMPAVVPGAVIEYKWTEVREDLIQRYTRLQVQRDIPIQIVKYAIKPLPRDATDQIMRPLPLHCQLTPFVYDREGFAQTTVSNVPAFRAEPNMPPVDEVSPWVLLYYSGKTGNIEKYWTALGKQIYQEFKTEAKVNEDIRAAAKEAKGSAKTEEETIANLLSFCRVKIKNLAAESTSAKERTDFKPNKSSVDTLKQKLGTGRDINMLFAAMALAEGLDAREARMCDRGGLFFDRSFADSYFLPAEDIAIKFGSGWHFYDAAGRYFTPGMLRWQEEDVDALVSDPKDPSFVRTPATTEVQTFERYRAKLSLKEDGSLEGDASMAYGGHFGVAKKAENEFAATAEREQNVRDEVKRRWGAAEVTNIRFEGAEGPDKPFAFAFHIRIEGFAQRTGKRLLLPSSFFRAVEPVRFTAEARVHPVYFHYPWSEDDVVNITVPDGFELDNPDAPASFAFKPVGEYGLSIAVSNDKKTVIYSRKLIFGKDNKTLFPITAYAQLKKVFERIHESDTHTLSFKQAAPAK